MLGQDSITTSQHATTTPLITNHDPIQTACNHVRRAANVARRIENLCEIDFRDLETICSACRKALQSLAQLQRQLTNAGKEAA